MNWLRRSQKPKPSNPTYTPPGSSQHVSNFESCNGRISNPQRTLSSNNFISYNARPDSQYCKMDTNNASAQPSSSGDGRFANAAFARQYLVEGQRRGRDLTRPDLCDRDKMQRASDSSFDSGYQSVRSELPEDSDPWYLERYVGRAGG